ncbi:MAG: PKD domain-containing protein, partial [Thermoplasmata archaeon]|nr:PKD domain-containing protein [Thermoplasmata archaeon]
YDWTNRDLKYAKWTGTTWIAETVDSEGTVGGTPSIALDGRDYPHIGYFGNSGLKYAKWTGSNWSIEIVDAKGEVGMYTSLSLDGDINPHISYFDSTNKDLKYARWTGSSWNIETVDSFGGVGMYTSLALDRKDLPHISYFDETYEKLKYARKVSGTLSYDWDFDDGSPHGMGEKPTHRYNSAGIYNVTLTVTDEDGATDADICIITVLLENQPPVADAGPDQTVYVGNDVQFDGSGSYDPDGEMVFGASTRVNDVVKHSQKEPSIAIDSEGGIHVVWWDNQDPNQNRRDDVYYSKSIDGGRTFQTSVRVNDDIEYTSQWSPAVVVNDNLDVYVVWADDRDSNHYFSASYYFSKSTDGGQSFSADVKVNNFPGGSCALSHGPDIGSLGNSAIFVAWEDCKPGAAGGRDIYFSKSLNGGYSFVPEMIVNDDGTNKGQAWATMDVDKWGVIYLAFADNRNWDEKGSDIYFSKSTDQGKSFESNVRVNDDTGYLNQTKPSIFVDNEGNVNVVWEDMVHDYPGADIRFARSTDGGKTFGSSVVVNDIPVPSQHGYPDVAVSPRGDVYVVWGDWRESDSDIYFSVSRDGGKTFGDTTKVNDYDNDHQWLPSIAVDDKGTPHIVYQDDGRGGGDIYYSRGSTPLLYNWDFGDGSPNNTSVRPKHAYSNPGIYNVTLTVTDEDGATDTDNCIITVLERNQPPVADAGPDQNVLEGDTVQFNGTGSHDPDGGGGTGEWVRKAHVPSFRMGGGSATLNDEMYFIGGVGSPDGMGQLTVTDTVEVYNATNDTWYGHFHLPEPRSGLGAAAVGGKIYVIGGNNGTNSTDTTFEFDPVTGVWTKRASMPMPLEGFGIATVNDKIYIMGGYSTLVDCYPCGNTYEYDPSSDSWTQKTDLPTGRNALAAVVLDGKIFAIGGDANELMDEVEVYDPVTDTWTTVADMIGPRSHMRAEVLGGDIFVMGGYDNLGIPLAVYVYDPFQDNWTVLKAQLVEPRIAPGSGVVGSCVYLFGGHSGHMIGVLSLNEEYCLDGELEYEWDFDAGADLDGDGNYINDKEATGSTPTHIYYDDGVYTVTLTVTDSQGDQGLDQCNITVHNVPPTPEWTSQSADGTILNPPYPEGKKILFEATVYDPGIYDTFTYDWDFGDGTILLDAGKSVTHAYGDNDTYIVVLKVTDDDGGIGIDDTPPLLTTNENPVPSVDIPYCIFLEGSTPCEMIGQFTDPGWLDTHSGVWDFGDGEYE